MANPRHAQKITGSSLPTMYAWEGSGVWVLQLTRDNWDAYNALPPTFDENVHLENLKTMGATWYENPRNHDGAAKIVELEQGGKSL